MNIRHLFLSLLLVLASANSSAAFRVLTTDLPDGTTNGEYFAVLLTVNSAGPITWSMAPGSIEPLPVGLTLDPQSGAIYGYPTVVDASVKNTFRVTDGVTTIDVPITWKISASGGGGNSGAAFGAISFPDGRVGVDYSYTLTAAGGDGSFVYGAQNLPIGITLDGLTGEITGNPVVAGTFFVTLTLNDLDDIGESNKVVTTVPMVIYPADVAEPPTNVFKFDTQQIGNGEVGSAYSTTLVTSGFTGTVTYSATGLPAGLSIDQTTGVISGSPSVAGTFYIYVSAFDDGTDSTISTNLVMWVMANSTSKFYWDFFGVPAGLYGMVYDRQPPILVDTNNGTSVTYGATGLPPGISYNSTTGELSGTPTEVGISPVIFTATDTGPNPDETITLEYEFIVLPPSGGDVSRLAVNLWPKKLLAKVNTDLASAPNDSWSGMYIYNQDRTTGNIFDPATDDFYLSLGSSEITLPAGTIIQASSGTFSYTSPKGQVPAVSIKGTPSKQSISVKVSGAELGATMPTELIEHTMIIGSKGYKLKLAMDEKGKFTPTMGFRNAAFIVEKGTIKDTGTTKDALKFTLDVGDPSFTILQGDTLKLRIFDGTTLLLDKDMTDLVTVTQTQDKLGNDVYTIKKAKVTDPATENILKTLSFVSTKGLLNLSISNLVLNAAIPNCQAHLGVELVVNTTSYFTGITLFESASGSGSFNTVISKNCTP